MSGIESNRSSMTGDEIPAIEREYLLSQSEIAPFLQGKTYDKIRSAPFNSPRKSVY